MAIMVVNIENDFILQWESSLLGVEVERLSLLDNVFEWLLLDNVLE